MPSDSLSEDALTVTVTDCLEVVLLRKTDKIYAFSLARDGMGRIIASETGDRKDLVGIDIFVYLGFSRDEKLFLIDHIWDSDAVAFPRAKSHNRYTTVIFNLFRRGSTFLIALKLNARREEVFPALHRYFEDVAVFGGAGKYTERELFGDSSSYDEAESRIDRICEVFAELASIIDTRESCDLRLLESVWAREAEMLGLPLLYRQQKDLQVLRAKERMIFDGASLLAVVTTVMIVVKRYADGNPLILTVRELEDIPLIEMSFPRSADARWISDLKRLYGVVENSHDHVFRCVCQGDSVRICFCPFYEESAVFSVKARDVRELFFCEGACEESVEIVFLGSESE